MVLPSDKGHNELLIDQLIQIGRVKQRAEAQAARRAADEQAAGARDEAHAALDPDDPWVQPIDEASDIGMVETLRAEFAATFADKPDDDPRKKWLGVLLDLKQAEVKRRGTQAAAGEARDTRAQAGPDSAPGTPEQWAAALREKLAQAGASNPDAFTALRGEIGEALAKKVIPARMASELHQEVAAKFRARRNAA
jgi:hypothetical protein